VPIRPDEMTPGVVAYMCTMTLRCDRRVAMNRAIIGDMKTTRPYLCVAANGGQCSWIPLTSRNPHGTRLEVQEQWRRGGSERWQTGNVYVQCFRKEVSGPRRSFVLASDRHDLHAPGTRPYINPDGMDVILRVRAWKIEKEAAPAMSHDPASDHSEITT
jgi:hypothetical protein